MIMETTLVERPARKRSAIVIALRQRILQGRFPPGSRLPPQTELVREFAASTVTVQRAIDRLKEEGLLVPRGRQGTFVHDTPPHLCRYGLVFPDRPNSNGQWSGFHRALWNEAKRLEAGGESTFFRYTGLDDPKGIADYHQLVRDVQAIKFAGLIFPVIPFPYIGTPILTQPGIPRVAVMVRPWQNIAAVWLDDDALQSRVADMFIRAGRRRVAIVDFASHGSSPRSLAVFRSALRRQGIACDKAWHQGIPLHAPEWAAHLIALLMGGPSRGRPDAMWIADDNLVPAVVEAMGATGLRIPRDVFVVGHGNFPRPTPSSMPIGRAGYHAGSVLEAAMASIRAQRRGEAVGVTVVPPVIHEA